MRPLTHLGPDTLWRPKCANCLFWIKNLDGAAALWELLRNKIHQPTDDPKIVIML